MNATPMMNQRLYPGAGGGLGRPKNPWASDEALLSLSVWWVKASRFEDSDITGEVATVFKDLQSRLQ